MRIVLAVIQGPHRGLDFSFEQHDNFIVGRSPLARFRLPVKDKFFSRIHFMVEINPPLCRLLDMGSTNGTLVNNKKVATADLRDGDLIKAGKTVLRVSLQESGSQSRDVLAISAVSQFSADFEHGAIVEPTPAPSLVPSASFVPFTRIGVKVPPTKAIAFGENSCRVCLGPLLGKPRPSP